MHFAEAGVIMLAMLFVATIRCDDCPAIPKHYEELGCKAIKDDREYCTKRLVSCARDPLCVRVEFKSPIPFCSRSSSAP